MAAQPDSSGEIFVVDDDATVRELLSVVFTHAGYCVSGFANGASFLAALQTREPACVLLDVHMTGSPGLEILRALKVQNCGAPVFMISADGDVALAVDAIKNGAFDYIVKPFDCPEIVARVGSAIAEWAMRKTHDSETGAAPYDFPGRDLLTPRESEVLAQIAGGASNKEVGRQLGISPRTVEVHRARIMYKLGARNAADLVRIVFSGKLGRSGRSLASESELVV